jgi:hypothetical protein
MNQDRVHCLSNSLFVDIGIVWSSSIAMHPHTHSTHHTSHMSINGFNPAWRMTSDGECANGHRLHVDFSFCPLGWDLPLLVWPHSVRYWLIGFRLPPHAFSSTTLDHRLPPFLLPENWVASTTPPTESSKLEASVLLQLLLLLLDSMPAARPAMHANHWQTVLPSHSYSSRQQGHITRR